MKLVICFLLLLFAGLLMLGALVIKTEIQAHSDYKECIADGMKPYECRWLARGM